MEVGTLMASAPLVRAASRALTSASDRVARAMAIRCLQRLPVPLEGTLLSSLTDANTLAMCHAMGPQAVAALVCREDLDSEMERWGYGDDARYSVAVVLDNLDWRLGKTTDPPGSLIEDKSGDNGSPRIFNRLQEQPLAKSWVVIGEFSSNSGRHLLLEGDGNEYATFGLLSQPVYYVLAASDAIPAVGGPPDLVSLLMADEATYSTEDGFKEGIRVVHKIMEMASHAYEELGRPAVISQDWLRQRCMAGAAVARQDATPTHSVLAVFEHIYRMEFNTDIALATLEGLFLAWIRSASSVRSIPHRQGDGLVSACIGANCGVTTAVVLPELRQAMINVYPSGHGIQVVYLPGFNAAVILPGAGENPEVDREPQLVGPKGESSGMLLPFLVKLFKSGVLKESTKPACRTLAREIGEDLLAVISPVSEGLLRALKDTRVPELSECFKRNRDLSESQVVSVMQWLGVRWLEGPAGDFTCVLMNSRIAHGYYRTSSLSCEVDCPHNREGGSVAELPDGRLGLVAVNGNSEAKVLPLVDAEGRHVKGAVHQLKSNRLYRCTSWEPVSAFAAWLIERPLYVG